MRVLYVTTISTTMESFPAHIRMLKDEGHVVELACNMDAPLPEQVKRLGCKAYHIPFSRSPLSKDNILAYKELNKILEENNYDIVHTHLPKGTAQLPYWKKNIDGRALSRVATNESVRAHKWVFPDYRA